MSFGLKDREIIVSRVTTVRFKVHGLGAVSGECGVPINDV